MNVPGVLPYLRAASLFLTAPVFRDFWHSICAGNRRHLPDESFMFKRDISELFLKDSKLTEYEFERTADFMMTATQYLRKILFLTPNGCSWGMTSRQDHWTPTNYYGWQRVEVEGPNPYR